MGNVQASITTPAFITRSVADYASEEHEKTTSACDYLPHRDESNPAVYITKVYWYTPDGRRWCMTREALCSAWINLANRELLYSSIEAYAQNVEAMRPASLARTDDGGPIARRLSLSMSPTVTRRMSMGAVATEFGERPRRVSTSAGPSPPTRRLSLARERRPSVPASAVPRGILLSPASPKPSRRLSFTTTSGTASPRAPASPKPGRRLSFSTTPTGSGAASPKPPASPKPKPARRLSFTMTSASAEDDAPPKPLRRLSLGLSGTSTSENDTAKPKPRRMSLSINTGSGAGAESTAAAAKRRLSMSANSSPRSPTFPSLRSLSMSAARPEKPTPELESDSMSSGTASPLPPDPLGRLEVGRLRGELNNLILYLQHSEERGLPPRKPDAERAATLDDILEFALSPAPSEVDLGQSWRDKLERVEQTFGDDFALPPTIAPGFKDAREWRVRINEVEYAAGDEMPELFRPSLCSCSVCSI